MRHIKGSPRKGLVYENRGYLDIVAYTDVYWVGSPSDRRSTSRYYVLIGDNLISWKSKKKNVVATSNVEVKY